MAAHLVFTLALIVVFLRDGFRAPYLLGGAIMQIEAFQHRDSVTNTLDTKEWETV